jgi:hypothetical protein
MEVHHGARRSTASDSHRTRSQHRYPPAHGRRLHGGRGQKTVSKWLAATRSRRHDLVTMASAFGEHWDELLDAYRARELIRVIQGRPKAKPKGKRGWGPTRIFRLFPPAGEPIGEPSYETRAPRPGPWKR